MSEVYIFENLTVSDPKDLRPFTSGKRLPFRVMLVTEILGSPDKPVAGALRTPTVSVLVPGLYMRSVSLLSVSPLPPAVSTNVIKWSALVVFVAVISIFAVLTLVMLEPSKAG